MLYIFVFAAKFMVERAPILTSFAICSYIGIEELPLRVIAKPLTCLIDEVSISDDLVGNMLTYEDLTSQHLSQNEVLIPLGKFVNLFEKISDLSENRCISWDIGSTYELNILGELGYVVSLAPTLGEALRCLVNGFETIQTGAKFTMSIKDDMVIIQYQILDQTIWPRCKDAELTLGIVAMIISKHCNNQWLPNCITYEHSEYAATEELNSRTRHAALYNQEFNSISFPASLLDQRAENSASSHADFIKRSNALNKRVAEIKRSQAISTRVKFAIMSDLGSHTIDQTKIAEDLGMSRRTLRRRLSNENINFQALVDDCRKKTAYASLTRTKLPLCDIAFQLGYSDQTAFTRAFSRWFGCSPKHVRDLSKSGDGGGSSIILS